MNSNDELREMVNIEKHMARMNRTSFCMEIAANGHAIRFMALYLKKDMQNIFSKDHPLSETRFSIFDHELAHAVIPEARAHKVKAESVADSYMALRHFQRYGAQSPTINTLMRRRAVMAFFNQDADHFTPPALEKILEVKDTVDPSSLTPAQTAKLAARIGARHTINEKEKKYLSRQFNKLRGALIDTTSDQPLRDFAEMVFRARTPLMKKWGQVALSAFVDGDIHLQKTISEDKMQTITLRGKYWDGIREKITPSYALQ
jgi:hypothetical protein